MRNASRFRPSPALVISLIALFVSVSGVAWAAATIGTNDIKDGAVTGAKLHNNSVNTQKIVDGAVTSPKLHNNSVNTQKIASNAVNGGKVADGSLGTADLADNTVNAAKLGAVVTRTASITVPANSARQVSASCDPGAVALSAGASWSGAATVGPVLQAATFVTGSPEPTGGTAAGRNGSNADRTLTVIVTCLQ